MCDTISYRSSSKILQGYHTEDLLEGGMVRHSHPNGLQGPSVTRASSMTPSTRKIVASQEAMFNLVWYKGPGVGLTAKGQTLALFP